VDVAAIIDGVGIAIVIILVTEVMRYSCCNCLDRHRVVIRQFILIFEDLHLINWLLLLFC